MPCITELAIFNALYKWNLPKIGAVKRHKSTFPISEKNTQSLPSPRLIFPNRRNSYKRKLVKRYMSTRLNYPIVQMKREFIHRYVQFGTFQNFLVAPFLNTKAWVDNSDDIIPSFILYWNRQIDYSC